MEYNFNEIERKWREYWKKNNTYKVEINKDKPKYYVLDMFPYPSGAGLHVGHPLGYIASDIYSRYKRLNGFNVLHPMGYDAFGLPAEQYAIQTGQHPKVTTENNIKRYREQLDKIGFSYDWSREVRTSDPHYYKWTQWVFVQLFNHYFDKNTQKAEPITKLIETFNAEGNINANAANNCELSFTASEWNAKTEKEQQEIILCYRLAYMADSMVNWCPALGTVLANDEVKEGYSVRGGHPVYQKLMKQWLLRITAYAERLLNSLDNLEWTDSMKEMQRNWIGRSEGANITFNVEDTDYKIEVFTTRQDTIYGSTFIVLAPEHELVDKITTKECSEAIQNYIFETKKRTERERLTDVKTVSGQFTGAYVINPFTKQKMPIWISDYVLAGYGSGAIMAVPAHDSRDFAFAKHFNLTITKVVKASDNDEEFYGEKEGIIINSDIINGLTVKKAITKINDEIEKMGIGERKVNYRLRDAIFSRQRYWGEPFPIYFKDNMPYSFDIADLPLELPEVDKFLPTEDGQPPLGRAKNWVNKDGYPIELSTMPGFAGSSAYYLRYMDSKNDKGLVSKEANNYWQDVDLYIGGTEHATGHLLYSRFWNKFLYDMGIVCKDEPFKKLINQGMIQGRSNFMYKIKTEDTFVSYNLRNNYECIEVHVDVNIVENDILDVDKFKHWLPEYKNSKLILEDDGKYHCGWGVEKMSKSMYNVVNPDDIITRYGADTLRMYEMFLGPLEQSKPWDTNGIEGVHRFLKKLWRLFFDKNNTLNISDAEPTQTELKVLHKIIRKVKDDIEGFSFNTSISAFMICVNELSDIKCNNRKILNDLVVVISPFAPHIAEELWQILGNNGSVCDAIYPNFNAAYLIEDTFEYPVSFNGKMRFKLSYPSKMPKEEIEKLIVESESAIKWLEGKPAKKVIVVPNKIINIVV